MLGALAIAAGCATPPPPPNATAIWRPAEDEPIPPSLDPIVLARGDARPAGEEARDLLRERRPVEEDDAGWEEKLALARGYAAGGLRAQALDVVRAALAQEPPPPWDARFKQLRTSLRVRRVEEEILRVDARGARDYVPFGEDVDWLVRLRNVGEEEIAILSPPPGAASPSALSLTVVRRDLDIYGGQLERSWNQTLFLLPPGGPPLRIPPGGSHEVEVRVPAADVGEALSGIRVLVLSGTLRLVGLAAGEREEAGGLPVRAGRVVVLPRGFEPLAKDPLGSMERAQSAMAPAHLLVAAEFVPSSQGREAVTRLASVLAEGEPVLRPAALSALRLLKARAAGRVRLSAFAEPLVDALARQPAGAEGLMQALVLVSGQALPPDPRLWMDWWRRALATKRLVPAAGEGA